MKSNPTRINGKWLSGVALDVHTLASVHLGVNEAGHDIFENTRSELGELLYRLKYKGDKAAVADIVEVVAAFLQPRKANFDIIIPVPPSGARSVQPVITVANGVGAKLRVPVVQCVTKTRTATQLKGVIDQAKRKQLLEGLYAVDAKQTRGKKVMLFDDLFRSGATMNAITDLLLGEGRAECVRVLAITKTRSNQ